MNWKKINIPDSYTSAAPVTSRQEMLKYIKNDKYSELSNLIYDINQTLKKFLKGIAIMENDKDEKLGQLEDIFNMLEEADNIVTDLIWDPNE